jgi:hypothetical protein
MESFETTTKKLHVSTERVENAGKRLTRAARAELRAAIASIEKRGGTLSIEGDETTLRAVRQMCVGRELTVNRTATGCTVCHADTAEPSVSDRVRVAIQSAHDKGAGYLTVDAYKLPYVRTSISRESKRLGLQVITRYDGNTLELLPQTVTASDKGDLVQQIDDAIETLKRLRRIAVVGQADQAKEIL